MNNTIKFKSKKYKKNITAELQKYDIMFKIEEQAGIERCIFLSFPDDDYDIIVLLDELNKALPKNMCVCVENGIPTYYKKK